jgi:ribosomal protein L37AE/L43A
MNKTKIINNDDSNESNDSNYSDRLSKQRILSDEDKIKERKEARKQYNKQIIRCECCDVSFARSNYDHHVKTQKHLSKKIIFDLHQKNHELENKVQQIKVML